MTDQQLIEDARGHIANRYDTDYKLLIRCFEAVVDRFAALQAENAELREENGCLQHNVAAMQATLDQQAENCEKLFAEKDKEIEQLNKKATLNAFIKYAMKRACEELVDTESALSRVEAERDAAISDVPNDCEHCKYAEVNGACKLLPDGDEFSPDYTEGFDRDGNCDHWEWLGAQGEG